jgi:hypothetical protein
MARFRPRHDPLALDDSTVNALLTGAVEPDDAPPGYGPVARVLAAAASPPQTHETEAEAEQQIRSRFRATIGPQHRPATARQPQRRTRVLAAIALTTGGLLVGAGAAAASGNLPGPLQQLAHTSLAHLGVSIPDAGRAAEQPPGPTTTPAEEPTAITPPDPAAEDNHGQSVCRVASDGMCEDNLGQQVCTVASDGVCTDPHGREICTLASDGTCRAGTPSAPDNIAPPTTSEHRPPPTANAPPNPSDEANNSSGDRTDHAPDTPPTSTNPHANSGQAKNEANP